MANMQHLQKQAPKFVNIQPKMQVNQPGDRFELEADAMANRVMRMADPQRQQAVSTPVTGIIGRSVQRKCAHCKEENKKKLMRKVENNSTGGMPVSSSFAASLDDSKGSGSPLPSTTKGFMQNAFNADFSDVKIHTGAQASAMSEAIHAKAFTHGNDIYFNEGAYATESGQGKMLLAHELTHVVQQSGVGATIQRYDNCSAAQNRIIDDGLARARRRSTRAIQIVADIQSGRNSRAAASLQSHFGVLTPAQITIVHDRMVEADTRLNNAALWRCDTADTYPQCGGTDNWWAGTLCPTTSDPTHLCPPVFTPEGDTGGVEPSRAMLLIHEALRAAGACGGFYPPGARTPPDSLINVYSYTQFMFSNASANR